MGAAHADGARRLLEARKIYHNYLLTSNGQSDGEAAMGTGSHAERLPAGARGAGIRGAFDISLA
jgi:hypothetical protein